MPPSDLAAFNDAGDVNVIVESPRGATAKFKWNERAGMIALSRPLPAGLVYPCDWGFVPGTRAADGDPLDAFVLWDGSAYPGVLLVCKVLGVLRIAQTPAATNITERNDRITLVPVSDARQHGVQSIDDVPERRRLELEQFFKAVVAFEPKRIELQGWGGRDEALALVRHAAASVPR